MNSQSRSPIRRDFLGWNRPALPNAVERLAARYRRDGVLDLGSVIVVVPGNRAGRRLQELLAFLAEDEKLRLTPPEVVTEGELPEMLYTPKQPFATDIVQDLAWAQALRDLPVEQRRSIVPHAPADTEVLRWLEIGAMLRRLHVELAADGLDFGAVQLVGPKLPNFTEAERWEALAAVQRRYHALLDGLQLWDKQTARLKAIEFGEVATDRDIILLGTVDLNNTLRQMLEQIAERVTAYVVAPEDLAERFDAHGCLVASAWGEAVIPLRDEQLQQVDGPVEQADAVATWLAEVGGRFRNDEVAIGVPDPALVPQLQRQLQQCDVHGRWPEAVRLAETAPYRLLATATQFASDRHYDDLAALVRHPDCETWLQNALAKPPDEAATEDGTATPSLPAQLDEFYNTCLPSRIRAAPARQSAAPEATNSSDTKWPDLAPALERIDAWLAEASTRHPLRVWANHFGKILGVVYGGRTLHRDEPADELLHRTIKRILDACEHLRDIPDVFDTAAVAAVDAFAIGLGPLAKDALPPPHDAEAVEILGWLELPLDDSRGLVVTSFNEGFVPQSTGADAFLPDRLRRELRLLHTERRYARDAYAISVLCQAREELRVVFARRDTNNNPLLPSRLIFACADDVMIRRAQRCFDEPETPADRWPSLLMPGGKPREKSAFEVPRPIAAGAKLNHISVTRFRDYLACPYRYYLRHVRKLKAVDDAARELDGSAFGSLLHATLSSFGRLADAPRLSTQDREIVAFLDEQLHALAKEFFGANGRRASVRLQLEQARQRLRAFAGQQAALVRDGWRILYAEDVEPRRNDLVAPFAVDDESIQLVGRIDRIDFHERLKKVRILDYKTGDKAQTPKHTHRRGQDWIDLQLPLYRHLRCSLRLEAPPTCAVELGYFNLPKDLDETKVVLAEWDEETLDDADEIARFVIRQLRNGIFWPPKPPPEFAEDFAAICLDNARSGPVLQPDDTEGLT